MRVRRRISMSLTGYQKRQRLSSHCSTDCAECTCSLRFGHAKCDVGPVFRLPGGILRRNAHRPDVPRLHVRVEYLAPERLKMPRTCRERASYVRATYSTPAIWSAPVPECISSCTLRAAQNTCVSIQWYDDMSKAEVQDAMLISSAAYLTTVLYEFVGNATFHIITNDARHAAGI